MYSTRVRTYNSLEPKNRFILVRDLESAGGKVRVWEVGYGGLAAPIHPHIGGDRCYDVVFPPGELVIEIL